MQHLISEPLNTDRFIDQAELTKLVRISKSQIQRLEHAGLFPKRVKVGLRRVAWSFAEVQHWIEIQKRNRNQ